MPILTAIPRAVDSDVQRDSREISMIKSFYHGSFLLISLTPLLKHFLERGTSLRHIMSFSKAWLGFLSLFYVFFPQFQAFLVFNILQGAFHSFYDPCYNSFVNSQAQEKKVGEYIGILHMMKGISNFVPIFLFGSLFSLDWRMPFIAYFFVSLLEASYIYFRMNGGKKKD